MARAARRLEDNRAPSFAAALELVGRTVWITRLALERDGQTFAPPDHVLDAVNVELLGGLRRHGRHAVCHEPAVDGALEGLEVVVGAVPGAQELLRQGLHLEQCGLIKLGLAALAFGHNPRPTYEATELVHVLHLAVASSTAAPARGPGGGW